MSHLPRLDVLPREIKTSPRALVWNYETRHGKTTKVPYQPKRPTMRASVDDSKTWDQFMVAYEAVENGKADGVGVVLGNGLVGIDFDHCRDPQTGDLTPDVRCVVETFNSYTEVSPSGTGLHVLLHADLPPGNRRRNGVEVYSDKRYFTITGEHVTGTPTIICPRQVQLQAFWTDLFGAETTTETADRPVEKNDLDDAVLLAQAQTAANGETFRALWNGDVSAYDGDDSAADLALCNLLAFWTGRDAVRIDRLFRQSRLIRPKWDEKRGQFTYGHLTITKAIVDCTDVYEPAVVIEIDEPPAESVTDTWPQMLPEAYYGLFGDLVAALAPLTEADPVALLLHALVDWGSVVGRTPYVLVGGDRHHGNEFLLIAGDTATGRKGTAHSDTLSVLALVDPDWSTSCLVSGLSSGEGLIHAVRDPIEEQEPVRTGRKVVGYQPVIRDAGVSDKRKLVFEPEFGRVLRVSRREHNVLSATLRQSWDTGHLHVLTRHSPAVATNAHVTIVAHCTPAELRAEVRSTDMAGGLLNRFLIAVVKRSQVLPDPGTIDPQIRQELVDRFDWVTGTARRVGVLGRDRDARDHWASIYPGLTRSRAGLVGAIANRAPSHVVRLSLLYALADESATIRVAHQQAAHAVWQFCEASVQKIFRRRTGQRLADYLLSLLRQSPTGLTRTQIRDALGRNRHADEISEALTLLKDYGLARTDRTQGTGPPTTKWFATTTT